MAATCQPRDRPNLLMSCVLTWCYWDECASFFSPTDERDCSFSLVHLLVTRRKKKKKKKRKTKFRIDALRVCSGPPLCVNTTIFVWETTTRKMFGKYLDRWGRSSAGFLSSLFFFVCVWTGLGVVQVVGVLWVVVLLLPTENCLLAFLLAQIRWTVRTLAPLDCVRRFDSK